MRRRLLRRGRLRRRCRGPGPLGLGLAGPLLHLGVNLARLLGIQPAPEGHRVEFEVPDEISGAAVLDLVQEEGLLRRVPMRVFVVDLCVRTTDVRPYQRHRDRLPVRRLALGQALQGLAADALGVLEELLRDVVAGDDPLHSVVGRDRRLVRDGIQELAVEPEAPRFPVADEALDRLLHDVFGALRVLREVVFEDLGVFLALLHGQLAEAERKSHVGLLHDEHPPSPLLDLLQQPLRSAVLLVCEERRRHGHAQALELVHVR
mmetsp:Transcript_105465/g.206859  ORF Transcript_105465/g.206859 Transcript_105465/m.206859 type:complete len:262 (+) Transcript_105465:401-1186(+)